jgi:hypothetical protein
MALELLDTKWVGGNSARPGSAQAGEVEPEHILAPADGPRRTVTFRLRVCTATSLARLLADAGFAEIECFRRPRRGQLSRVRAGSLREPESRSHDVPSPPTATASMDVGSCPVEECVEIQPESLQVPPSGGHRGISSQRSAACEARPRDGPAAGDHTRCVPSPRLKLDRLTSAPCQKSSSIQFFPCSRVHGRVGPGRCRRSGLVDSFYTGRPAPQPGSEVPLACR